MGPGPGRTSQGTVLVVDDDPSVRSILTTYFGLYGFVVRCATNTKSALEVVASERPVAVLVDLSLRDTLGIDRSGLDVIENILLWDPTLHIALFTSFLTAKVMARIRAMGIVDIIEKPAMPGQLLEWIGEENTQPETPSGRWGDVSPRRVLYLFGSIDRASVPSNVQLKAVLTGGYEIVLQTPPEASGCRCSSNPTIG